MSGKSGWQYLTDEQRDERIQNNRVARMNRVDEFDPQIRTLIHEYGLTVVQAFHDQGVTKPKQIRHLVECVLDEFSPTRGSFSRQGVKTVHGAHP